MRGIFTGPLQKIKEQLLMMASLADRNLAMAMRAYFDRDDSKADLVESEDDVIDQLEMDIDEQVVTYVSTHGPIATPCRLALMASKISEALESIGDQSVTIARRSRQINQLAEPPVNIDIAQMANTAICMMRDSINAFVDVDPLRAEAIVAKDKLLDGVTRDAERELNEVMMEHSEHITACLHLLFITRSLEKIGDHAKAIARDVIYLYTAHDTRHEGGSFSESSHDDDPDESV